MALFRKNKNEDSEDAPKKRGKIRKNESLASVFKETVMESALEDMRANPSFDVEGPADFSSGTGHETYHVCWLLEASSIGGLSKKAAKDEEHGSIIECVNSNRIKVILNRAMMDMDVIAFVMDPDTIDAMGEFSILREASYQTIYISDDASVMSTDGAVEVSFADAENVSNGKIPISRLLVKGGCLWLVDDSDDFDDEDDEYSMDVIDDMDAVESPVVVADQDIPFADDAGVDDNAGASNVPDEYAADIEDDAPIGSGDESLDDIDALLAGDAGVAPGGGAYDMYGGPDDISMNAQSLYQEDIQRQAQQSDVMGRTIDAIGEPSTQLPVDNGMATMSPVDAATQIIRSAYFTHELGLEITTAPFDEQFGEGNPVATFDENRGDGFMNEYLSQISREANADMRHLRDSNLRHMRERYIYMMSLYAKRVTEELDVSNPETRYGKNKAQIKAAHDKALNNIDERVESLRSSLQADFDRGMAQAAELAAAQAKEKYRHKHESALKQQVMDAEARVRADVESTYQADINKMYEARRHEAAKRMDAGVAEILGLLSREYSNMYVDEYRLYRQYREEISRWIDNNRKDDIAYAETLREEQRQAEKADEVRADYEVQLRQQAADYEQRRQSLEEDIERDRLRHEALLSDVEARHSEEVASLRSKNDELQRQFDDLLDRYSSLDATKAQEYDLRLKQAKDEAEVERKRAEQASEQNKGAYRMIIVLLVVSVIAALLFGIVIGMRQNIDYVSNLAQLASTVTPLLLT